MNENELNPCPACGGKPILTENWEIKNFSEGCRFTCKCEKCPLAVETNQPIEYTAKCWNDFVDSIENNEALKTYILGCRK